MSTKSRIILTSLIILLFLIVLTVSVSSDWIKPILQVGPVSAASPISVRGDHQVCRLSDGSLWLGFVNNTLGYLANSSSNGDTWTITLMDTVYNTPVSIGCNNNTIIYAANNGIDGLHTKVSYNSGASFTDINLTYPSTFNSASIISIDVMDDNTSYIFVKTTNVSGWSKTTTGNWSAIVGFLPSGSTAQESISPYRFIIEDLATDKIHVIQTNANKSLTEYISSDAGTTWGAGTNIYDPTTAIFGGGAAGAGDSFWCDNEGTDLYCAGTIFNKTACFYYNNGSVWKTETCFDSSGEFNTSVDVRALDAHIVANTKGVFYVSQTFTASGQKYKDQLFFYNKTDASIVEYNITTTWNATKLYMPHSIRRFTDDMLYFAVANSSTDNITYMRAINISSYGSAGGGTPPTPASLNCSYNTGITKFSYKVRMWDTFPQLINVTSQNSSLGVLVCNNTGGTSGTFQMKASSVGYTNVSDICAVNNTPTTILTTSYQTLGTLGAGGNTNLWCLRNYSTSPGTYLPIIYSLQLV